MNAESQPVTLEAYQSESVVEQKKQTNKKIVQKSGAEDDKFKDFLVWSVEQCNNSSSD